MGPAVRLGLRSVVSPGRRPHLAFPGRWPGSAPGRAARLGRPLAPLSDLAARRTGDAPGPGQPQGLPARLPADDAGAPALMGPGPGPIARTGLDGAPRAGPEAMGPPSHAYGRPAGPGRGHHGPPFVSQ